MEEDSLGNIANHAGCWRPFEKFGDVAWNLRTIEEIERLAQSIINGPSLSITSKVPLRFSKERTNKFSSWETANKSIVVGLDEALPRAQLKSYICPRWKSRSAFTIWLSIEARRNGHSSHHSNQALSPPTECRKNDPRMATLERKFNFNSPHHLCLLEIVSVLGSE